MASKTDLAFDLGVTAETHMYEFSVKRQVDIFGTSSFGFVTLAVFPMITSLLGWQNENLKLIVSFLLKFLYCVFCHTARGPLPFVNVGRSLTFNSVLFVALDDEPVSISC